jgi:hypothetical protein
MRELGAQEANRDRELGRSRGLGCTRELGFGPRETSRGGVDSRHRVAPRVKIGGIEERIDGR